MRGDLFGDAANGRTAALDRSGRGGELSVVRPRPAAEVNISRPSFP